MNQKYNAVIPKVIYSIINIILIINTKLLTH